MSRGRLRPALRSLTVLALLLPGTLGGCRFDPAHLEQASSPCAGASECQTPGHRCVAGWCVRDPALAADQGAPADASDGEATDLDPGADAEPLPLDAGPPPLATFSAPTVALLGDEVVLDASASTGAALQYAWTVEAPQGGTVAVSSGPPATTPASASFRALQPGTYRLLLQVSDRLGRRMRAEPRTLAVPGWQFFPRADLFDAEPGDDGTIWVAGVSGAERLDPARASWTRLSAEACSRVALGAGGGVVWFALQQQDGLLEVPLGPLQSDDGPPPRLAEAPRRVPLPELHRARVLRLDPRDQLWVGGLTGIQRFPPAPELPAPGWLDPPGGWDEVLALLHAADGTWLGRRNGLCRLDLEAGPADRCAEELPVLTDAQGNWQDPAALDLGLDAAGRLLLATDGKGLFRRAAAGAPLLPFPATTGSAPLAGRLGRLQLDATVGEVWLAADQALLRLTAADRVLEVPVPHGQQELGQVRSLRGLPAGRGLVVVGSAGLAITRLE